MAEGLMAYTKCQRKRGMSGTYLSGPARIEETAQLTTPASPLSKELERTANLSP